MEDQLGLRFRFVPFAALAALGVGLFLLFFADFRGRPLRPGNRGVLGHVTRAFGTVKRTSWLSTSTAGGWLAGMLRPVGLDDSWNRLESGREILVPFSAGDVVQTGEESGADLLFYGGSRLHIEPATLARFEDDGESVSVRLVMGKAHIDLTEGLNHWKAMGRNLGYRRADGALARIPEGKRLLLTMSAAQVVDESLPEAELSGMKLTLVPERELGGSEPAPIVPPIEDRGTSPPWKNQEHLAVTLPEPVFPENDGNVDVTLDKGVSFKWEPVGGYSDDPVVSYEIVVRPAPGYEVEDTARKIQVLHTTKDRLKIEKVNGGGVFLWSVRAVSQSGERGPASAPRWLEIKFPKVTRAPQIIKPKVE